MNENVSVTREISAPADRVWEMVSDLPRMGEWSPENEGGVWLKDANGPLEGVKFRGANRLGKRSWKTVATHHRRRARSQVGVQDIGDGDPRLRLVV